MNAIAAYMCHGVHSSQYIPNFWNWERMGYFIYVIPHYIQSILTLSVNSIAIYFYFITNSCRH